jgi:hypothetical protein
MVNIFNITMFDEETIVQNEEILKMHQDLLKCMIIFYDLYEIPFPIRKNIRLLVKLFHSARNGYMHLIWSYNELEDNKYTHSELIAVDYVSNLNQLVKKEIYEFVPVQFILAIIENIKRHYQKDRVFCYLKDDVAYIFI